MTQRNGTCLIDAMTLIRPSCFTPDMAEDPRLSLLRELPIPLSYIGV
jgi:hypothetical protein